MLDFSLLPIGQLKPGPKLGNAFLVHHLHPLALAYAQIRWSGPVRSMSPAAGPVTLRIGYKAKTTGTTLLPVLDIAPAQLPLSHSLWPAPWVRQAGPQGTETSALMLHVRDRVYAGILLTGLPDLLFSVHDASIQAPGGGPPVWELLFFRSPPSSPAALDFGGEQARPGIPLSPNVRPMLLRTFLILAAWLCFDTAARYLQLAELHHDLLRCPDHRHRAVRLHPERGRAAGPMCIAVLVGSSAFSSPAIRPGLACRFRCCWCSPPPSAGPVDRAPAQDRHAGKNPGPADPQQ